MGWSWLSTAAPRQSDTDHLDDLAHRLGSTGGRTDQVSHTQRGVTMTTFAPHRDAVEFFIDCMHGSADKDALAGCLAEDVVLYSPLGDEPLTGREAVAEAMRTVGTKATDLTYKEVL